jgi:hypothetical protein
MSVVRLREAGIIGRSRATATGRKAATRRDET